MKKSLLIIALLFSGMVAVQADDISDAKAAFQTLIQYQKSDDPNSLGLFTPTCAITYTFTDGTNTKDVPVPMLSYSAMISKAISEKKGNHDTYENPTFTKNGNTVTVNATVMTEDKKAEPITIVYMRDQNGEMAITQLHVVVPVAQLPK